MKTVAILSRKGGSGKSTFAVHLAVAAEKAGHTTALIDLDPQASAVKWSRRREGDSPVVISAHSTLLNEVLVTAEEKGVSLCILDTSPHSESAALDAAKVADLAVIPSRPAIFDLEAVGDTIQIASIAKVPIRVVLNGVKPFGSAGIKAKKALGIYDGLSVAPCTLGDRVAFSHSVVDGVTAQEYEPKGKASREVGALYAYLSRELAEVSHHDDRDRTTSAEGV